MQIEKNCWEKTYPIVCIFEGYSFSNGTLKLFMYSGLIINSPDLEKKFNFRDEYGVGNCVLIFSGVKRFEWTSSFYTKPTANETIWGEPNIVNILQNNIEETQYIALDGSLNENRMSSTYIEIEAKEFNIHILD
jgi:hypothetical protein